jgi:hypothetical protein
MPVFVYDQYYLSLRGVFAIKCIKPLASAIEHIGTASFGTSEHVTEEHLLL